MNSGAICIDVCLGAQMSDTGKEVWMFAADADTMYYVK